MSHSWKFTGFFIHPALLLLIGLNRMGWSRKKMCFDGSGDIQIRIDS